MKIGNPQLALYYETEQSVRVYELINNSFVLINSAGGYLPYSGVGGPIPENLMWHRSTGKLIYIRRVGTSFNTYVAQADGSSPVQITSLTSAGSVGSAYLNDTVYARDGFLITAVDNGSYHTYFYNINDVATNGSNTTVMGDATKSNYSSLSASKDGIVNIATRNTGNTIWVAIGADNPGTNYPYRLLYAYFSVNIGRSSGKGFLSEDGTLAIIANVDNTILEVYRVDVTYNSSNSPTGVTLTKTNDIPTGLGAIHNIISSPDKSTMAFVYVNEGVYTTYLFGKYGDYIFKLNDSFTNFGARIEFSADGLYLVDGLSKKMRRYDGTQWINADAGMSNIVAGATGQALSDHVQNQITMSRFYNGAIEALTDGRTLDLRLFLLNDTATFDASHTSISQLDSSIVRAGMWPQDGVNVNITREAGTSRYYINTNNLTQAVVETSITARYALIYDKLTNKPMIFYDLINNRVFPVGSRINIGFTNSHLVTYTE